MTPGRRRRRLTQGAALAVSTVLHAGLLFFLVGAAAGDPVSGGGSAGAELGPVFEVSLAPADPPASAPPPSDPGLAPLIAKLSDAPPEIAVPIAKGKTSRPFADLFDRLRQREPEPQQTPSRPETRQSATAQPSQGQTQTQSTRQADPGPVADSASTGDLWGRIEPCWRKSALRAAVPVTLEVSLDARGQLSRPPRILRDGRPPDEQRLAAEERALASLTACLPRGDLRFGGAVYRLDFRPPS